MLTELDGRFGRIEAQKAALIGRVCTLDGAAQSTAPKVGEWSPLQVIAHLVLAEELMAGEIEKAAGPEGKTARPKPLTALMVPLLCGAMRAALPMPPPPTMEPPPSPDPLEASEARWSELRAALRTRLETVADPGARNFSLHPILGLISARQALDITEAHLTYHTKRFPRQGR